MRSRTILHILSIDSFRKVSFFVVLPFLLQPAYADHVSDTIVRVNSFIAGELKNNPDADDLKSRFDLYDQQLQKLEEDESNQANLDRIRKVRQDLRNSYYGSERTGESDRRGFIPGFMYVVGKGSGSYLETAFVDSQGIIREGRKLDRFARIFPSITYYAHFNKLKDVKDMSLNDWFKKSESEYFYGWTFAFNDGLLHEGGGAFVLAFTLGVRFKGAFFSLFYGNLWDQSIKRLPSYLYRDRPYPVQSIVDTSGTPETDIKNHGIDVPLEKFTAIYSVWGIAISLSIDWSTKEK